MEKIDVEILVTDPSITVKYYSSESGGFDLHTLDDCTLLPNEPQVIKTGLSIKIPCGFTGLIKGRSSLGLMGVNVFNGVIDSDYRGEIKCVLCNLTNKPIFIEALQRVAQLLLIKTHRGIFNRKNSLETNGQVRTGGFGSTGI